MPRLSVLFIAAHPVEGPSTRFRIHQYLPALAQAGIRAELRPFLSSRFAPLAYRPGLAPKLGITALGALGRLGDLVRASRADLVYVLREAFPVGPEIFERAMAALSGRLAFDFDDAIWERSFNIDNPIDRLRDFERPARLIARANRTVVGSDYLAAYARRHAPAERVVLIPTVVDTESFRPAPRPPDGRLVVGWIGTPRNTAYLRAIWPGLAEAARRDPRLHYCFVGAEPFPTGEVQAEFRHWTLESEIADIQGFDIGIMPLPDDPQTRGKCGFKIIEYMACGLPAVASPVGANVEVMRAGETGLLANGNAEWAEALYRLAGDAVLRRAMGEAGRARAVAEYSLAAMTPRFIATIEAAAG
ncbi:glycosyltransferase family 4 protein [Siccirubricoccus phaeus]|uniref:glycosyltransferase family 4 protein n=1 Tax=Siccirubricoccus phaeus TaxID=2595053 RepID=UPI0011F0FF71|nr:glycosyltransferase family 4 protein [Siccirubricoccus phaeus]